jgi:hypothetical protein
MHRREAERGAVQDHRHGRAEEPQRAQVALGRVEPILGDHFDHIDRIEVREDRRRELGAPAEAEAI